MAKRGRPKKEIIKNEVTNTEIPKVNVDIVSGITVESENVIKLKKIIDVSE